MKTRTSEILLKQALQPLPLQTCFGHSKTDQNPSAPRRGGLGSRHTCEGLGFPTSAKQKLSESRADVGPAAATLPGEAPPSGVAGSQVKEQRMPAAFFFFLFSPLVIQYRGSAAAPRLPPLLPADGCGVPCRSHRRRRCAGAAALAARRRRSAPARHPRPKSNVPKICRMRAR